MKKIFMSLLCAGLVFGAVACSDSKEESGNNGGNQTENPNDNNENPGDNNENPGDNQDPNGPTDPTTPNDEYASLNGSDYYVMELDEVTYAKIAGRVKADLRVDDVTTHIWHWTNNGAFTSLEPVGPNFYGEFGWFAVGINPARPEGWFGLGLAFDEANGAEKKAKLVGITAEHTLHFAMKSTQAGNYAFSVLDAVILIGQQANADVDFPRDGEWHEIEIPMAELMVKDGYSVNPGNIFSFVQSDDPWPIDINLSGCFIYKK